VWTSAAGPYIDCTPAIGQDGTIYVADMNAGLYAINPDGSVRWCCTDAHAPTSDVSIGPDGTVYCSYVQGAPPPDAPRALQEVIYAVNPAGELVRTLESGFDHGVPSFAADGTLYLLRAQALYALNPAGTMLWTYSGSETGGQSVAVDAQGTLYFGTSGTGDSAGSVVALNPDGSLKWSWNAPGPVPYGPLVIGQNNMLYVGDHDGRLLALGPK
jgi:outer membrane protein assembly factor BamB